MPKKARGHHYQYSYKPAYQATTTSPPSASSLSSTRTPLSNAAAAGEQPQGVGSVNYELQRLRKTKLRIAGETEAAAPSTTTTRFTAPSPTMHPSLQSILSDGSAGS